LHGAEIVHVKDRSMPAFTESVVEDAALAWLESLGYAVKHGPEIAPGNFSPKGRQLLQKMQQLRWANWGWVTVSGKEIIGGSVGGVGPQKSEQLKN
jgi:hypothetical protein